MKIRYQISGEFYPGMSWEDFIPVDDNSLPMATIEAVPSASAEIVFDFDLDCDPETENLWYAALVSPELTPETAKRIIAAINGVSPDEIEIVENVICIAL